MTTPTSADYATASADTAVAITYAATAHVIHRIHTVIWSYHGGTVTGTLTIAVGGSTVAEVAITSTGPGFLPVDFSCKMGDAAVITLAAGGAAVVGKLTVTHSQG